MMLTGRTVDARRARRIGLVDQAVPLRIFENTARMLTLEAPAARRLPLVKVNEIGVLIRRGVVRDGMIPKLRSCARTLGRDVRESNILPPAVPGGLLAALNAGQLVGTRIVKG